MEHIPLTQAPAAFAGAHTVPQPPQLLAEVRVSTSQPLAGLLSQSAKPGSHTAEHEEPVQVLVWCGPAAQRRPHEPQFIGSVAGADSQPLAGSWSQSACIASHVVVQRPEAQTALPPAVLHGLPQRPQFIELLAVSTHEPPHAVCPSPHAAAHTPPAQNIGQRWPHMPQLLGSVWKFTQPASQACIEPGRHGTSGPGPTVPSSAPSPPTTIRSGTEQPRASAAVASAVSASNEVRMARSSREG
jgi:hypothetical protein